jgi:hypothetical protein
MEHLIGHGRENNGFMVVGSPKNCWLKKQFHVVENQHFGWLNLYITVIYFIGNIPSLVG